MDITYVCVVAACSSRAGVEHVWAEVKMKMHVTACEADGWLTPRRLERPTSHAGRARAIGAEEWRWTRWPGGSDSGTHTCMQGVWFPSVRCVCANTKHTAITPFSAHSHGRHGCNLALSSGWDRRGHALLQAQSRKRHSAIGSSPQKSTGFCGARQGLASVIAAAGMGCFLFLASCALWLARLGLTVFSASWSGRVAFTCSHNKTVFACARARARCFSMQRRLQARL